MDYFRQKEQYTRLVITEEVTQQEEFSWMVPPEGFIGRYIIFRSSGMVAGVVSDEVFNSTHELITPPGVN